MIIIIIIIEKRLVVMGFKVGRFGWNKAGLGDRREGGFKGRHRSRSWDWFFFIYR